MRPNGAIADAVAERLTVDIRRPGLFSVRILSERHLAVNRLLLLPSLALRNATASMCERAKLLRRAQSDPIQAERRLPVERVEAVQK